MQSSVRRRRPIATLVALVLLLTVVTPALGASPSSGFSTDRPAMLDPVADDVTVKALISVGDMVGAYRFESLPDGIAIWPRDRERVDLYVNHETSKVPFQGFTDYRNSEVSHLLIKRGNGKILSGDLVVPSSLGYQRFCSNFFAGRRPASNPLLLTNEETTDFVIRQPKPSWPRHRRRAGRSGGHGRGRRPDDRRHTSPSCGMGRHNHENAVAIPGYDEAVVVSAATTRSAPRARSSTCTWPPDGDAVWNDDGPPVCLQVRQRPTIERLRRPPLGESITGEFIPVPRRHRRWRPDRAGDVVERQQRLPVHSRRGPGLRPRRTRTCSTSPTPASLVQPTAPRLARASASGDAVLRGDYMNGRIWKMVLDPDGPDHRDEPFDPARRRLRRRGYSVATSSTSPTTSSRSSRRHPCPGRPGTHNSGNVAGGGFADATNARIWLYDLATGRRACRGSRPVQRRSDRVQGHVGVKWHRRCFMGLRPGCLPGHRPGPRRGCHAAGLVAAARDPPTTEGGLDLSEAARGRPAAPPPAAQD